MDRANTRSAIAEANRLEPPKPISIPSVSAGRAPESPALDQSTGGSPVAGSLESGQAKETGHGNSVVSSMRNSVSRLLVQWAKAISPLMSGPSSAVSQGSPAINSALSADRAPDNAAPSQSTGRLPDDASSESAASKEAATQKSIMSSARRELSSLLFQLAKAISPLTSGTSSAVGQESSAINQALSAGPAGSVAAVSGSLSSASKIGGDGSHSAVPGAPETPTLNQPAGGLAGPSSGESASSKETPTDKSVVSSMRNEMSSLLSQLVKAVSPFLGRSSLGAGQGASGIPPALSAGPAGSVAAVPSSLSSASKASGYASVPTRGAKSSKSKMKKAAMKKKLIHRNGAAARGKTLAGTSDVPLSNPSGGILPGVGTSASDTASVPGAAANGVPSIEAGRPNDPWKGRQNEAIALVIAKTLPRSKITIGNQARAMLQEMHEKELMHAANTGERLYLPDKLAWTALQEEGFHYRVYLNFLSWQANGERVQSRSYQFLADLKTKEIRADDPATQQDLLTQPAELTFKHNPMATDIDSILGGVDTYNKHKVQLIIVKKNGRNRDERKKMEAALNIAAEKVRRAVIYFRRTYSEKALQNVAKAYDFLELLKG
jgi:hypothetical protein